MLPQKSAIHPAIELVCSGMIFAIFAIFFGVYTNDQLPTCIDLYYWSRLFLYVLIISTIICFTLIPFAKPVPVVNIVNQYALIEAPMIRTQTSSCAIIIKFIKFILGITNFVCYILLWVKYLDEEECGNLRTLVFVYLLIVGIAICVCLALVCFACFFTIFCISLLMNSRFGRNQRYEISNRV